MSLCNTEGLQQGAVPPAPPTFDRMSSYLDLLISLHLHAWPALTLAIQNAWGGSPQVSSDKRDWFAGALSELLLPDPKTQKAQISYLEDLEDVMLHVMLDEFEVVVDDGSAEEVAQKIWKGKDKILNGDFAEVQELNRLWQEKRESGEQVKGFKRVDDQDGHETDWDEDDDEEEWNGFQDDDGNDDDEHMSEAPPLIEVRREKPPAEVDEDGFTKVVGRRKR